MAKIQIFLKRNGKSCGKAEIMFRLSLSRSSTPRAGTGLFINPDEWDDRRQCLRNTKIRTREAYEAYRMAKALEAYVLDKARGMSSCDTKTLKQIISSCSIQTENGICTATETEAGKRHRKAEMNSLTDIIASCADAKQHSVTKGRMKHYNKLLNFIRRMERWRGRRYYAEQLDRDFMEDFKWFFYNEHTLFSDGEPMKRHIHIYDGETGIIRYAQDTRSDNYFSSVVKVLKTVIRWANENGIRTDDIFKGFTMPREAYGTPWYILPETRNKLYTADLSENPHIAAQRDIFIFQSLVGCRYGDLERFTKANIKGDCIEYIAQKTASEHPETIRVPLHKTALEIIERYDDGKRKALLPFISRQKYNEAIKKMFLLVPECDQLVTILDPKTHTERQVWLHEVASSHMCRRNLIGALKESGCPDEDICAISGHAVGSKAIARYRKISDERKRTMIDGI